MNIDQLVWDNIYKHVSDRIWACVDKGFWNHRYMVVAEDSIWDRINQNVLLPVFEEVKQWAMLENGFENSFEPQTIKKVSQKGTTLFVWPEN